MFADILLVSPYVGNVLVSPYVGERISPAATCSRLGVEVWGLLLVNTWLVLRGEAPVM